MVEASPTISRTPTASRVFSNALQQKAHTSAAESTAQRNGSVATRNNSSGQQATHANTSGPSQKGGAAKIHSPSLQSATAAPALSTDFEWGRALVGAAIGAVGGAIVGGLIGARVGGLPGALIGAGIGAVVGGVAGGLIGGLTGGPTAPAAVLPATATVPAVINAASTPTGMGINRIPPRIGTTVSVSVTSLPAGGAPVIFSIEGNGGSNGTATINGSPTFIATAPGTFVLTLSGTAQTAAGSAGNLRLVATQGTTKLATSGAFSISSVPQKWSTAHFSDINTATALGVIVTNSWESDSGNVADLDEVQRSEQVQVVTATGVYAGIAPGTSTWKPGNLGSIQDQHQSGRANMTGVGYSERNQAFIFKCARTGANNIPATKSGFKLTREVKVDGAGFRFYIKKFGAGVTANSYTVTAASGSVARDYPV